MSSLKGSIFLTGGSGTLGHALVRTAMREHWDCRFTIYSRSELLQAQMRQLYPGCRFVLGDVRDYDRLQAAVAGHDLVIHAAAMKRIPECEANPTECIATNVQGSTNVVRACLATGIGRCVGISTDKACGAITTYGASKRAMEGIFQAQQDGCWFTLVRYGNVVGSRGSVIPVWRDQADRGLPLTITDQAMTRFWMSEDDAVHLVVQAAQSPAGTITVPKMGALSVLELAQAVAPGAPIHETGRRSYEKLHEDLIHPDEPVTERLAAWRIGPNGRTGTTFNSANAGRLDPDVVLSWMGEPTGVAV